MCRTPGCLKRLLRESSVTLHTCKEEGCVHPVQVKRSDDRFPSQLVSDVAGVVDPHQLTETLTPPRGQMQPHMEAVLSLRRWVPPAEPIPLKLGRFLLLFLADNSENFGLIVRLLRQTEMTEQNRLHSGVPTTQAGNNAQRVLRAGQHDDVAIGEKPEVPVVLNVVPSPVKSIQ